MGCYRSIPLKESRPPDSDGLNLHEPREAPFITSLEIILMYTLLFMAWSNSSFVNLEHWVDALGTSVVLVLLLTNSWQRWLEQLDSCTSFLFQVTSSILIVLIVRFYQRHSISTKRTEKNTQSRRKQLEQSNTHF